MKVALPFVGGAYEGRSKNVNAQECINLFLEPDPKSTRAQAALIGAPGTSLWDTVGSGPIRGMRKVGSLLYVVSGNKLYSVTTAPADTELGTLNSSTGLVSISDNGANATSGGQQVIIVDGTDGYIWDIGSSEFSEIGKEYQTIAAQDETDFNNTGSNGTFVAGSGYSVSDVITMSDGSTITVDAVSTGAITQFTVTTATVADSGGAVANKTLTQTSVAPTGGTGFTLTLGDNNETLEDHGSFSAGNTVTFMDGYFVKEISGTGRFQISNLYDGRQWDATDFATAESDPGDLVAVISENQQLWLIGTTDTEIWYNSGDADFPFERYQGGFIDKGTPAHYTVAKIDNSLMWLAQDERGNAQVVRASGPGQVPIVSTPSINYQMQQYTDVSDAFAWVYQSEGHEFYVLTFPTANETWVYDALTNEWHRRANTISANTAARLRFNDHTYFAGKHLVGDYSDGKIYDYSTAYNEYDGSEAMVRVRATQHTNQDDRRISVHRFEVILEGGNGGTCDLKWAKDNGQTYGTAKSRSMGNAANARVFWTRLGRARDWVFHWTCSSNVKVVILAANAHIDGDNDGSPT